MSLLLRVGLCSSPSTSDLWDKHTAPTTTQFSLRRRRHYRRVGGGWWCIVGGQLSTVGNHDIDNRYVRIARFGRFNHLNNFHALDDTPKHDMFAIQMRRGGGGDKIRAWTGIGHMLKRDRVGYEPFGNFHPTPHAHETNGSFRIVYSYTRKTK